MSEKKQLNKEQLEKVTGGTQEKEPKMVHGVCPKCNGDFWFDENNPSKTISETGELSASELRYWDCPLCGAKDIVPRPYVEIRCPEL